MTASPEDLDGEQLWRAVLTTAVDPIVVIDELGTILRTNDAVTALLGHRADDLLGRNVSVLMPEPYRSAHDGYLRSYGETGVANIIGIGREVHAQHADGTIVPVALAVSEVGGTGGKLFTGILHDLSSRYAAEERLREANESLERRVAERSIELEASIAELARSNRDLEQFAYIASHDLQTPLRNVRQGLALLDEHLRDMTGITLDDEAQELRSLVDGAVTRMEELIGGILSIARVNRSAPPVSDPVDLNDLIDEVVRQLQLDLYAAEATVVSDTLPIVLGDAVQLRQLIENLIGNSLKYRSTDRPPEIRITASEIADHWAIAIGDNGIGIDEAQHERIFDLFRRGHPGYDGVGLGLTICQRIVERHGGTITVTSRPGEGAVFTFTLPKTPLPESVLPEQP